VRRLAAVVLWGGAAGTQLLPLAAAVAVSIGAREVTPVKPHSPEMVALNREIWSAGEPVAELYGNPSARKWVLFPPREKLVVPPEDPSLTLLLASDNPLQLQTVWFFAGWGVAASTVVALLGAALYWVSR
jgi:hypothetical protein